MNTHNDDLPDPEDAPLPTIGQPTDMSGAHLFCGSILNPYTFVKRSLINRLSQEEMSGIEYAAMFLWALSLDPVRANAIRGEEKVTQALLDAQEWADKQGFNKSSGIRTQAMEVVEAIRKEADEANNWEIEPPKGNLPVPDAGNV